MDFNNLPDRSSSLLGKRGRDDGCSSRDSDDGSPSSGEPRRNEAFSSLASPSLSAIPETQNSSPFGCTYDGCVKTFATAAHRKRHERSHTGVLPYGCPLCGKRFARSDVRGRHITGIHEKDPTVVLKGIETRRGKSGELSGDAPELSQPSSSKRQSARPAPQVSNHSRDSPNARIVDVRQQLSDTTILPSTLPSGPPGGPFLTNDRIVSQILQPASLPSPGPMGSFQQNFHSPRDQQQGSSHDLYPPPNMHSNFAINVQDTFPQPSLANLAGPTPHPSMEMLLQAVSTSRWSGPSVAQKQPFDTCPPFDQGDFNAMTPISQSSQIPTGYINLGLPTDTLPFGQSERVYIPEEGIADVFGWGVNSADWMQLYDSMGMDSNLVAPADLAQMLQPHNTQPQTMPTQQPSLFLQNVTTTPSAWMASQLMHSNSATPPSSINDQSRRASSRADPQYQSPGGSNSLDPVGSADYSIPSELPDNHEAYPSRTSRINRDIKLVSEAHHDGRSVGVLGYGMLPGGRTRNATEELPQFSSEEQRPNAVLRAPLKKRTLALPQPVLQHPSNVGEYPTYVGSKHHTALLRLIHLTHEPTFLAPDLTNFPDPGVMSTCIGLYFEHFHPVLPVLRPEAFRDIDQNLAARDNGQEAIGVDHDAGSSGSGGRTRAGPPTSNILEYQSHPYYPLLLLTMCAIGATYAKQDWKSMSIYMNELARRAGKHLRDRDSRAVFSKQYMQARLLQAVAGLAIGSRDLYLESEMTRSILVSAARRSNLLRPLKAHADTPPLALSRPRPHSEDSNVGGRSESLRQDDIRRASERETEAELELRWYKWLEEEERRRLGWGIYIVDSQGASILNVPATFALDEIHAALPSTKELWIAPTAAAWDAAVKRAHREEPIATEAQPFNRVLRDTLQEGTLPRTVSDFGKNIIAHTLYRICIEASALNKLLVGDSASINHDIRHGSFPPNLKYDPYTLLERLGISWHDSVEHPSYFLITNDALRHHAYYKLVHPQFLDQVKYAAGQWESDASKSIARKWLSEWTSANREEARRVVVHSAQMAALLSRFTWDACWEPVWVLDCCLAMWAVVKFGGKDVLDLSTGNEIAPPSRKRTIKWSDAPDRVEEWVVSGGPTSFQGMQWELTPRNILTDFMARLEAMPWNVSKLYRSVLGRLLSEEDELVMS